ncbi:HalOD1 output domain-containing protein [Halobellus rarus]|uniref:HalOD1 output domain-containing protein n=1 Tax=Halobellus rarus TaxID=1126237 RepID=A0ABD6CNQ8_9EURY|nr:HalOD1 output domain-containing protein [Halobellus rarus]
MTNHSDPRPLDDAGTGSGVDGAGDSPKVVYTHSDGESPSHTVVEAVAEATHTDPTRLRPLYEVVDTDALDALITGDSERPRAPDGLSVTFRYEGCDVAVYGDGRTVVSRSAPR